MLRAGFLALAATACVSAVQLTAPASGSEYIAGRYVFELRANMTDSAHSSLALNFGLKHHKIGSTFRAVSGALDDATLQVLLNHGDVVSAESEQIYRAMQTCDSHQSEPVSWGQVRTTTLVAGGMQDYAHNAAWGTGVDSYILDTGIRCTHNEFAGGRCIWGANFAGGGNTDVNGHGTHCASTVAGAVYGLAKSNIVIAVKVLGDNGGGTTAGVIEGVQWAAAQRRVRGRPAVLSMSLGGGSSAAMNNAANAAVADGSHMSVASGNENNNACNSSPAGATGPLTVSSTELGNTGGNNVDRKSSFSNWGNCVDVWAPGSAITAAGVSSDSSYSTLSGTSMACPHVTGALAILLTSSPNLTPAQAKTAITSGATQGVIQGITDNASPNLLLHVQC